MLKTVLPDFDLLESLRLEDGRIVLMEKHLSRMKRSADYFRYPFDENEVKQSLLAEARRMNDGLYKMRLLAAQNGHIRVESKPIKELTGKRRVCLAAASVSSQDLFLYHKTTHRQVYDLHKNSDPSYYDTLLWNEKGYVTEFTNGNVVCEMDGKLLTDSAG
ncbi:aminotransferase class IV [Terrilactibacillus sp. S3-3]|nr:aminotransferase class IV [Terrilactibacillus sp. S3-3]